MCVEHLGTVRRDVAAGTMTKTLINVVGDTVTATDNRYVACSYSTRAPQSAASAVLMILETLESCLFVNVT